MPLTILIDLCADHMWALNFLVGIVKSRDLRNSFSLFSVITILNLEIKFMKECHSFTSCKKNCLLVEN